MRHYLTGAATMMKDERLAILRCPEDHSSLAPASRPLVNRVNTAIRGGQLVNRAGKAVTVALDDGLIRADGRWLYPIVDGIPVLLRDEAIDLAHLTNKEE